MDLNLIAILVQVLAAFFALKLIRLTGFRTAWVFIACAFCLMAARRVFSSHPISLWAFGTLDPPDLIDTSFALVISVLMLSGVLLIAPLFRTIKQSKAILLQAKEDLETKVAEQTVALREANARLSVELAERRQAEARLAQSAQELRRSNAELEQFAYVASHDLQEPLRMVASFTQLLAKRYRGKLGQDADEFIDFAVDGARRMQALINDLLAFSRVGTRGKDFEPIDCNAVLQEVLANLKIAALESQMVLTHDSLPILPADKMQLGQLFQNIIANAIKFRGPEPLQIHISAEPEGDGWRFAIQDNGIGIAKDHQERIFTIFQRLHSRSEYPGTGIGLAICKKIVERHGGRIWVDSEQGQGSTFYFTIRGKIGETAHGRPSLPAN